MSATKLKPCLESVFSVLEISFCLQGWKCGSAHWGGFWNRLNCTAYFVNRTISTEGEKALGSFETIVISPLAVELGVVIFLPSFQKA